MGLYWSSNVDTVTKSQLKTLIEGVPTYNEVATIIKANGGGTGFKPISAKTMTSIGTAVYKIMVGETKSFFFAGSDTGYISVNSNQTGSKNNLLINGMPLTILKENGLYYLPPYQKITIKFESCSGISSNDDKYVMIKCIGTAYEVE